MKIIEKLKELNAVIVGWEKETKKLIPVSRNTFPALLKIAEGASSTIVRGYFYRSYIGIDKVTVYVCKFCGKESVKQGPAGHYDNCPVALIEKGLEELKEAGNE